MSATAPAAAADQAAFAAALLDPGRPCPPDLRTWNGSDPARRLAVYRNNVVNSLVEALADTFEVTEQLVGAAFFQAMAAGVVRGNPPRSRILAHYGEDFAQYIAGFVPAVSLPYLPDVARLEFARMRALHAADAGAIDGAALARALAAPDELASLRLEWHPSVHPIASRFSVVSLWAAHQGAGEFLGASIDRPEHAVVLRDGLDVFVLAVDAGTASFVSRTLAGAPFGVAAAAAAGDGTFDLGAALTLLVRHGALVGLRPLRAIVPSSTLSP